MKEKGHPKYTEIKVTCSCGNTFSMTGRGWVTPAFRPARRRSP